MKNTTGVAKVTIGGKERPLYFGVMQAKIFSQLKKIEFHEYQEVVASAFGSKDEVDEAGNVTKKGKPVDIFIMSDILYSALAAGCKHPDTRQAQDFDEDTVVYWVQDMDSEDWAKVFNVMVEANHSPNASTPEAAAV